jgi:hypothetical protein
MPPTLTERQKETILSKVQLHKVTIIVGPTGTFVHDDLQLIDLVKPKILLC